MPPKAGGRLVLIPNIAYDPCQLFMRRRYSLVWQTEETFRLRLQRLRLAFTWLLVKGSPYERIPRSLPLRNFEPQRLSVVQQLTVFSASLYHRSLQVRLEKLSLETRTEAEARDQVR